jgi:hypothetical protein
MDRFEWLEENRKNIFWGALALLCAPIVLALAAAILFGLVLVGAWLGLWHLEMDH